jgi:hypothetical protein
MNSQFLPPRWAIDGIIPEGGSLLAGRPKAGKSWFLLNLALSIASGGVALGKVKVEKGEVLYLALEDGQRRLQRRLRKLLEKQGMTIPSGIFFATDWPRAGNGGIEALEKWIEAHAWTRLIIIDTMARFRPANSLRGDHYSEDYAAMGEVQKVALNRGVAILGVTHTRKPKPGGDADPLDEVQHSSGLTGAADAVLVLKRPRMSRTATLFITGRDVEEREIPLAVDEQFCLWRIDTPDTSDPDFGLTPDKRRVRQVLRRADGRPMNLSEILSATGMEYERGTRLIRRMCVDGLIAKAGRGHYALCPSETSDCPTAYLFGQSDVSDIACSQN